MAGLSVREKKVTERKAITQGTRANTLSSNTGLPVIQSLQEVRAQAGTRPPSDGVTQHKALHGERWRGILQESGERLQACLIPYSQHTHVSGLPPCPSRLRVLEKDDSCLRS